jgi:hypothetical protein
VPLSIDRNEWYTKANEHIYQIHELIPSTIVIRMMSTKWIIIGDRTEIIINIWRRIRNEIIDVDLDMISNKRSVDLVDRFGQYQRHVPVCQLSRLLLVQVMRRHVWSNGHVDDKREAVRIVFSSFFSMLSLCWLIQLKITHIILLTRSNFISFVTFDIWHAKRTSLLSYGLFVIGNQFNRLVARYARRQWQWLNDRSL